MLPWFLAARMLVHVTPFIKLGKLIGNRLFWKCTMKCLVFHTCLYAWSLPWLIFNSCDLFSVRNGTNPHLGSFLSFSYLLRPKFFQPIEAKNKKLLIVLKERMNKKAKNTEMWGVVLSPDPHTQTLAHIHTIPHSAWLLDKNFKVRCDNYNKIIKERLRKQNKSYTLT